MLHEQYLISIKPLFAYRIFAHIKKFELRKTTRFTPEVGSAMVVYASYPVRAIIGEFFVDNIAIGEPSYLMDYIKSIPDSGLGEEDFEYIKRAKQAMAIKVSKPMLYRRFVKLRELERLIPGFKPPLSMRPIEEGEPLNRLVIRKLREATFMMIH